MSKKKRKQKQKVQEDGAEMVGNVNEVNEVVEVTIDSGASKSVWPRSKGGVRRRCLKHVPKLAAANGTDIEVDGEAVLEFVQGKTNCEMRFLDAEVKKPLGAVSAIVDEGNEVTFRKEGGFIKNLSTGKKIWMKRRGGLFVIELEKKGEEQAEGMMKKKKAGKDAMDVHEVEEPMGVEELTEKFEEMCRRRYGEGEVVFRRRVP